MGLFLLIVFYIANLDFNRLSLFFSLVGGYAKYWKYDIE